MMIHSVLLTYRETNNPIDQARPRKSGGTLSIGPGQNLINRPFEGLNTGPGGKVNRQRAGEHWISVKKPMNPVQSVISVYLKTFVKIVFLFFIYYVVK
jgi:hypothetical protein